MTGVDTDARALRGRVAGLLRLPLDELVPDDDFNRIALDIFAYQFTHNRPYAAFCGRLGMTPAAVEHWTAVPVVPTAAFREVALVCGRPDDAEVVFRTSGTTQSQDRRGVHYLPDVSLYHFSLIPNFAACMLPDGAELPILSLVPPSEDLPDSSLSHMVTIVLERLGGSESGYFSSAHLGIADERLGAALRAFTSAGTPVCLLGTSFAFVHWLDRVRERGERFTLPPGSRLMDTGGYKGRSREVEPEALRAEYRELLGIPAYACVNEYGMTELCSQFYDATLRAHTRGLDPRRVKLVPPWVRTRVVDPETLAPAARGEVGILQHFDLANLGSVMAVQTEDLGREQDGGFVMLGRSAGALPRGCSVAMDVLLESARGRGRA